MRPARCAEGADAPCPAGGAGGAGFAKVGGGEGGADAAWRCGSGGGDLGGVVGADVMLRPMLLAKRLACGDFGLRAVKDMAGSANG